VKTPASKPPSSPRKTRTAKAPAAEPAIEATATRTRRSTTKTAKAEPASKVEPVAKARAKAAAVAAFRAHPQVEAVFTHEQLAATPSPTSSPDKWSLIERARASFDAERSGDFIVLLKRDITPIANTSSYVATHGSPWDYDRRVPILFWRSGMTPAERPEAIETADIMPTLAASIGLKVNASTIDGKCLANVQGIVCPAR
jgi:hypothetical protein